MPLPYMRCITNNAPIPYGRRHNKLEGYIDDERQLLKTVKGSQAPGDATILKRFSAITSLFFVADRKE